MLGIQVLNCVSVYPVSSLNEWNYPDAIMNGSQQYQSENNKWIRLHLPLKITGSYSITSGPMEAKLTSS